MFAQAIEKTKGGKTSESELTFTLPKNQDLVVTGQTAGEMTVGATGKNDPDVRTRRPVRVESVKVST